MICVTPISEIFKLLKRDDVINDDYVRLALYALYIQATYIDGLGGERDFIFRRDASSIEEIVAMLNRRVDIDSSIVLAYCVMRIVEPNIRWEIVAIDEYMFLRNNDRYVGYGDLSTFFDSDDIERVCSPEYLVYYSIYGHPSFVIDYPTVPTSIDILKRRIGERGEKAMQMWGVEEYIKNKNIGRDFTMYILYSVYSRIFSHYPLCMKTMRSPSSFSDMRF